MSSLSHGRVQWRLPVISVSQKHTRVDKDEEEKKISKNIACLDNKK